MSFKDIYDIPQEFVKNTYLNQEQYQHKYQQSIVDPDVFWSEQAKEFISWDKTWSQVSRGDFNQPDISWYIGGKLNVCYNCVDRHLKDKADQTAIIWEGDEPGINKKLTYRELHRQVCRLANVLKNKGVKKGDRVCIYLPMIPEAAVAMLACARIGAVHSVVFAGYSADALKIRVQDANCQLVITANTSKRGGKPIPLKDNVDKALQGVTEVTTVLVVMHSDLDVAWQKDRDCWLEDELNTVSDDCPVESMDANDPLFILYTSGSTGKPKGVLHSSGGYIVYAAITFHYIFDYHPQEIYWCTADVGWITGHSYVVYGPLANGATTLMFEGSPSYPDYSRFWQIVEKYKVNIFYTAPTAIRALRREGDEWVKKCDLSSLRLLGSVGEPINPEVWEWYYRVIGNNSCPIVDTWWQTETGGIALSPLPGAIKTKPGSACTPFFGIVPDVVDDKGQTVQPGEQGKLVLKQPWPGMMKTIFGNKKKFIDSYFSEIPGCYLTGDSARKDSDGYIWIVGRNDDVIKVSGHRIGTGELESAFLTHDAVSEAAVVAVPHDVKGSGIYAYIITKEGIKPDEELKKELVKQIRNTIGPIATPEVIQWSRDLPKTRSGKIMRRILRKIAAGETESLGDLSTLADPSVVDDLIQSRG